MLYQHCKSCTVDRNGLKARGKTPQSSKNSSSSVPLTIDEDRFGTLVGSPRQTRTTRSNPFGGYQQVPNPKAAKSKDTPSPASRKRSSSGVKNSSGPSKRHVSRGSRAVSHSSALLSTYGDAAGTVDDIKAAVNLGHRPLTPAPSDAQFDAQSPPVTSATILPPFQSLASLPNPMLKEQAPIPRKSMG